MNKSDLVVLRSNKTIVDRHSIFNQNIFYRCVKQDNGYIVYGEFFTNDEFDNLFELAYDRVIRDWKQISLVVNDKEISFTAFKKLVDVHQYGRGKNKLNVIYFRNNDFIYGFYPIFATTKEQSLKECYQFYLDFIGGNTERLGERIQYGNCGIPISYGSLRVR